MFRHVTTRVSGLIILIAGLWGGLIPFLGPYFHFTLGPDKAWTWTTGRLWLVVLPAAASVFGGLILMGGGPRVSGRIGALIALAGGAWFAIGPDVSRWWNHGFTQLGAAHGHHAITRMLEYLTLHTGVGVLIAALAAYSLPGAAAYAFGRRRVARDAAIAETGAGVGAAEARHRDRAAEREAAAAGAGTGAGAGTAAGAGTGTAAGVGEGAGAGAGTGAGVGAGTAAGAGAGTAAAAATAPAITDPTAGRGAVVREEAGIAGQAAGGPGAAPAGARPRRRGGLAGLFSRR